MIQTRWPGGANESALGERRWTKTASGILALQKASALPLKRSEDASAVGGGHRLIWLDFWQGEYNAVRCCRLENGVGENGPGPVRRIKLRGRGVSPCGSSRRFDAVFRGGERVTLENMLARTDHFRQYLDSATEGFIPKKQEMMTSSTADAEQADFIQADGAVVESLRRRLQNTIEALRQKAEQYEAAVKKMIGGMGWNAECKHPLMVAGQQVLQ